MTIIRPQKNNKLQNILIGLLSAIFIASLWSGIWMYGSAVELKHDIEELRDDLGKAEVRGADLKNSIYLVLNPGNLEDVAEARGLIKDKDPEYIQISENQGITKL